MSINTAAVSGNLTRDAELRQTGAGLSVLTMSVAVNERRRNSEGEWEDRPNYIDCVLFGKRAEALERKLVKGAKVFVQGSLRWQQWERDGQKRSKVEIVVSEIDVAPRASESREAAPQYDLYDEAIPF